MRIIEQLQQKAARLEKELRISKAVIDLQIKAHESLGIALPKIEDNDEGASSSSASSGTRRSRCGGGRGRGVACRRSW
jgi:hypothetical protein